MPAPLGNTYWMNCDSLGRNKTWESAEAMQTAIEGYFDECKRQTATVVTKDGAVIDVPKPEIPTVEGLAIALGFSDTNSLLNYAKVDGYEAFFGTIRAAKLYIKKEKVASLINGRGNDRGLVFDLKNNHGYTDKTIQEQSGPNGGPIQTISNRTWHLVDHSGGAPIPDPDEA